MEGDGLKCIFLIAWAMFIIWECNHPNKIIPLQPTAGGSYISQTDFNTLAAAIVQGCK